MSSLEVNKIAGAILLAGLVAMITGFIAHELVNPERQGGESGGAEIAGTAPAAAPAAPAPIEPVSGLIAKADAAAGQEIAKKCQQLPRLHQGRPEQGRARISGASSARIRRKWRTIRSSDAMKSREAKTWTYEELNDFLTAPKVDMSRAPR